MAAAEVDDATREHTAAQTSHDVLRAHLRARRLHDEWKMRHGQWVSQTNDLLNRIARELEESIGRVSVEARLAARIDYLGRVIENARIQAAIRESQAETIRANQASLDDSHGDCPVC